MRATTVFIVPKLNSVTYSVDYDGTVEHSHRDADGDLYSDPRCYICRYLRRRVRRTKELL